MHPSGFLPDGWLAVVIGWRVGQSTQMSFLNKSHFIFNTTATFRAVESKNFKEGIPSQSEAYDIFTAEKINLLCVKHIRSSMTGN